LLCYGSENNCKSGNDETKKECNDCNRTFWNEKCFNQHKDNKTCDNISKCKKCNQKIIAKHGTHKCGEKHCYNCEMNHSDVNHKCFIQKMTAKTSSEKYIFFDYETYKNDQHEHIPMYVFAKDFQGNKSEYSSNNDFCKWALKQKGYTFIAHYSKGYDSQFIYNYCLLNNIKPKLICSGTKIMLLQVNKVRFIDSYNFISQPLKSFPKTFGLTEMKKGFFPHKFNKPENFNYIGPTPSIEYYEPDRMKAEDRIEFLKWYDENKNKTFNFEEEMKSYCMSDVNILREACMIFRKEIISTANLDPFQYVTIASTAMADFRQNH